MTWFLLGGFGVMVVAYLLTITYMRRRDGIQPSHKDVLMMAIFMGCCVLVFYVLDRFGISLRRQQPRNIFWFGLGIVWLVLAVWTTHDAQAEPFSWTLAAPLCSSYTWA